MLAVCGEGLLASFFMGLRCRSCIYEFVAIFAFESSVSEMPTSESLSALWLSAPPGRLSPWQQARALALRDASREIHGGRSQLQWIADRVEKVGGGCPGKAALHKFFTLVDAAESCDDRRA